MAAAATDLEWEKEVVIFWNKERGSAFCKDSVAKEEQEERGYVEEGRKMIWSFILCVNLLFYDSSFKSNKIIIELFDKSTIYIWI